MVEQICKGLNEQQETGHLTNQHEVFLFTPQSLGLFKAYKNQERALTGKYAGTQAGCTSWMKAGRIVSNQRVGADGQALTAVAQESRGTAYNNKSTAHLLIGHKSQMALPMGYENAW